jgi:hypothetical protein
MTKMPITPHIITIRDRFDIETEQARHDWAEVTGKKQYTKPNMYIDRRTGWRFCKIIGAVAYPYIDAGCVLVAGIQSEPMGRVVVFDYQEHTDIFELIQCMTDYRKEYGYQAGNPDILGEWIGDTEKYLDIVSKVSQLLEQKFGHDGGLYVRNPAGWTDNKPFHTWARHLHKAIAEKRVILNGHINLINRLQSFGNENLETAKLETHPSVGIIAALVYTIGIERQWEGDTDAFHNEPINIDI